MGDGIRFVDVLWVTADKGGSRHYRADLPAAYLASLGYETFVGTQVGSAPNGLLYSLDGQWPVFGRSVVLQRQGAENGGERIRRARSEGQEVWIDCDDLLIAAPSDNHARAGQGAVGLGWWARMLPAASGLLCSTREVDQGLAKHNPRRLVVPNLFDGDDPGRWAAAADRNSPDWGRPVQTAGWVGNTVVHRANLRTARPWLADVLERNELNFVWAGWLPEVEEEDSFAELTGIDPGRLYARKAVSMGDYPVLFRGVDVGIVPLADSRFSRAKTCLKGLEYAAAGVPFLHDRHPHYEQVFGNRWRCRHAGEWRSKVRALVNDSQVRVECVRDQRDAMIAYCERSKVIWSRIAKDLAGRVVPVSA